MLRRKCRPKRGAEQSAERSPPGPAPLEVGVQMGSECFHNHVWGLWTCSVAGALCPGKRPRKLHFFAMTETPTKVLRGNSLSAHRKLDSAYENVHEWAWSGFTWSVFTCSIPWPLTKATKNITQPGNSTPCLFDKLCLLSTVPRSCPSF